MSTSTPLLNLTTGATAATVGATQPCAASTLDCHKDVPGAAAAAHQSSAVPAARPITDLSAPLYAIEHLAQLFLLEVDTARELTYRTDFPEPIKIGRRWLWFPKEIHTWAGAQKRYSVAERKRNAAGAQPAEPTPVIKPYQPRGKKKDVAA